MKGRLLRSVLFIFVAAAFSVAMGNLATSAPPPPPDQEIRVTDTVPPALDNSVHWMMTDGDPAPGDEDVTITNVGQVGTLNMGTIGGADPLAPPFALVNAESCSNTAIVNAGGACPFSVSFTPPGTTGTFSDTFSIPSDDTKGNASITFIVNATVLPPPTDQDIAVSDSVSPSGDLRVFFGEFLETDAAAGQTITVTNVGELPLSITSVTALSSPYTMSDLCTGQSLGQSETCTVTLTFPPAAPPLGDYPDSFDIISNDPDETTVTVYTTARVLSATNGRPTAPQLVSPVNNETGVPAVPSVTFRWRPSTDLEGEQLSYDLFVCEDATFATCPDPRNAAPIIASALSAGGHSLAGLGLVAAGAVVAGGLGRRKRLLLALVAVALAGVLILTACGGGGGGGGKDDGPNSLPDVTFTDAGLSPGTTYFWKVVAEDTPGNRTDSAVWSFTTQ